MVFLSPRIDPVAGRVSTVSTDGPGSFDSSIRADSPNGGIMSDQVEELIIEDLEVGEGEECPAGAQVTVHYRGTLMDGTEFDSSYKRGQPINFPLNNLIKGWQEGIPGMKVGGKRKLTIPYAMGYGVHGSPPTIPPKADLIFEIELLGVN